MKGQTSPQIREAQLQRHLRSGPTDAELALWRRLRGRQLEGCKFRRQHPYGDYILDFACLERGLVVEVDGGQHGDTVVENGKRTRFLESAGFAVLRFWNNEVLCELDGVVELILRELQARANPSPPNPPLEGEGSR